MKKTLDYLYRLKKAEDEGGNLEATNLYEAIAELEEAMKPKMCSMCKHFSLEHIGKTNIGICSFLTCPKTDMYLPDTFYCNRYEPKDTQ